MAVKETGKEEIRQHKTPTTSGQSQSTQTNNKSNNPNGPKTATQTNKQSNSDQIQNTQDIKSDNSNLEADVKINEQIQKDLIKNISEKFLKILIQSNIDLLQIDADVIEDIIATFLAETIIKGLKNQANSTNDSSTVDIENEEINFDRNMEKLGKRLGKSLQKVLI